MIRSNDIQVFNDATVYINHKLNRICVCGQPDENDYSHDCDVMLCSPLEHVLFSGVLESEEVVE